MSTEIDALTRDRDKWKACFEQSEQERHLLKSRLARLEHFVQQVAEGRSRIVRQLARDLILSHGLNKKEEDDPFCPQHGRASRPITIEGLHCEALPHCERTINVCVRYEHP